MLIDNDEHPIERIMNNAFTKIKSLIDADTIVGKAVKTSDNVTIIPISKLSMGFVTGGGEYNDLTQKEKEFDYPFAGGSGAGVSVSPLGFLVTDGTSLKLISVDEKNPYEKILGLIPDIINGIIDKDEKK